MANRGTPGVIYATSPNYTAVYHDLDLELPAGVPTVIPASAVARVKSDPSVIVTGTPPTPAREEV